MKKYILLMHLWALSVVAFGQNAADNKSLDGWKLLTEEGYEIAYPETWVLDQSKIAGTTFFLFARNAGDGKFRENINLLVQDLTGLAFNLDKFVTLSEQQVTTMLTNAKLVESKRVKMNGNEYHQILYQGDQGQFKLKWKQYYWVKGNSAYILTYTATQETYNTFIETADKILNSFKIKEH